MTKPRRHNHRRLLLLYLSLALIAAVVKLAASVDFVFNGFGHSDVSLYGNATLDSRILTLTTDHTFSIGRALYPARVPARHFNSSAALPFSTSFIFAMAPYRGRLPGHGIVFLFTPRVGIQGASSAQHLGLFNFTNNGSPSNRVFGVEFDVFANEEFGDINANHVGIDVNSLVSVNASGAGYWPDGGRLPFRELALNNGRNYQVWIDYADGTVNVTMAPAGTNKPNRPLLSFPLNLSDIFEDEMYVGFTAATGALIESHKILAWSFSNTNFSLSESLITRGLPNFELPKTPVRKTSGFIAGLILGVLFFIIVCSIIAVLLIRKNRRIRKKRAEIEDWELEYWPHRITYQEIESATKNFSEQNVIGIGGNGKVYRGTLPGGSEVAVKCISHENSEGIRAFLAEISSLGRLKHRNLVGLRGWCKKEKGSLILVYDYMENGSLDKRIFKSYEETKLLSFDDRIRILKQVAAGILYLHYGWESKVLHRDIKASNVLLDKDMNARLGDFGLARMHDHDKVAGTTRVVGTVGYLAPEVVRNGRASTQTDVFGYGVLILEVICGRRPIQEGGPPLLDWAWDLFAKGELVSGVDPRLRGEGGLDEVEVEKILHLGLLCAHPDPKARPTMRQVVKLLEGSSEVDEERDGDDDMDLYLLEKMKSREIRSVYPRIYGSDSSSHPTFDEIRRGLSNSMSLSWTDTIVDGR
ncbi:L-type lectin-domain containing receptor kinase VII.1 [Striga hermonthica]|uniref:non-specific serine/threonine protein kinase n=1 Tax=Striga hermonthica TaxID=68872 RepID=A0A9N7MY83_STRHE|nr:L-type lectin-domain containing receptor kinase VII.1 [Striga hermonthica]